MKSQLKKLIKFTVIIFLVLEGLLQLVAFFRERPQYHQDGVKDGEFRILVLGESTSYGLFLNDKKESYPEVLAAQIGEKLGKPTFVYNYSMPAATSQKIAKNFSDYLRESRPHLIICHFGNNDYNPALNTSIGYQNELHLPSILINLRLVKFVLLLWQEFQHKDNGVRLSEDGKRVYFNQIANPNLDEAYKTVSEQLYLNYSKIISLAKSAQIPLLMVSYFNTFAEARLTLNKVSLSHAQPLIDLYSRNIERQFLAKDLWHPSKEGHDLIAHRILSYLEETSILTEAKSPMPKER